MRLPRPFVAQCLWNTQPHTTSVLEVVVVEVKVRLVVVPGEVNRQDLEVVTSPVKRRGVRLVVDRDRDRDRDLEVRLVVVEVAVVVPVVVPVVDSEVDSEVDSVVVTVMDLVTVTVTVMDREDREGD